MEDLAHLDAAPHQVVISSLDVGDDQEHILADPGAAEVRFVPNCTEQPEPGGVN
jgi:hypothetical protein